MGFSKKIWNKIVKIVIDYSEVTEDLSDFEILTPKEPESEKERSVRLFKIKKRKDNNDRK